MSIVLIILFLAVMAVGEIILAAVLFKRMNRINEAIDTMKGYSEMIKSYYRIDSETYKEWFDKIITIDKDYIQKVHDNTQKYTEYITGILASEKEIVRAIHEEYVSMKNGQISVLETFKQCEQRYSDAYDQFSLCSNELKEVKDLLDVNSEDEYNLTLKDVCDTVCLFCPHDKCLENDCPVHLVRHHNGSCEKWQREGMDYAKDDDDEEFEMDPEEAELFREGDVDNEKEE